MSEVSAHRHFSDAMFSALFVLQGLLLPCFVEALEQPLVSTSQGLVQGIMVDHTDTTGAKFKAFLGIPYADQPVRFQLAKPRTPWKDTLVAQTDGPACPQPTRTPSSEDCLYLNVFTPEEASESSKLPVMVFMHGSAFTYSSSFSKKYGPDFLVSRGVILVTFNYRLGILGFLTLGSRAAPGNLGLHDSLLALQWVHDEISHFGGDPSSITLFGQSAGGAMAQFHYLSAISAGKGLFQRAIAQSGSALAPWSHYSRKEGARRGYQLAKAVGCDITEDDYCIVKCLQVLDIHDLVNKTYIPLENLVTGIMPFVPVLDDDTWSDSPFFGDSLETLIKKAAKRSIPMISGFNTDDGNMAIDQTEMWKTTESHLTSFIPDCIREKLPEQEQACFAREIHKHYFPLSTECKLKNIINVFTDTCFAYPSVKLSLDLKKFTYAYIFDFDGSWKISNSYFSQFNLTGIVAHGAEVPYLFAGKGAQVFDKSNENTSNLKVRDFMAEVWTNFAKSGQPGKDWQPMYKGEILLIDSNPSKLSLEKVKKQYYHFWNKLNKEALLDRLSSRRCRTHLGKRYKAPEQTGISTQEAK